MERTELLAPAGDFSCLNAAFQAGADAVYLAGKSFGARAFANNFSEDELLEALDYAHLFSKKIYLTLNTLIKESEFSLIAKYLTPYYKNGLDGIIIQDFGLIPFLKKEFPQLELHASTQMTVNNYRIAKWLKEQGICRVVPSRELSLEELIEIKTKAGVEVETFIHGAMCYGYSGQCLFSSFLGGRSGNRGRCAQPCRLPYQVNKNRDTIYPLSLKDLCSLPYIYELMDAKIDSFKIEGRMKSPEYVAGVTSIYRKYIDLYYAGQRPNIDKHDLEQLNHLYIRSEMKDGYFKKHNGKDMISLYSPSYQGCDDALVKKIHDKYCSDSMKLPIAGDIYLSVGNYAKLDLNYNELKISTQGDVVEQAQKRPTSEEEIRKQLNKTGNSHFKFENINIVSDDNIFIPVKKLNELRRDALTYLQEILLSSYRRTITCLETQNMLPNNPDHKSTKTISGLADLRVSVMDTRQLEAVLNSNATIKRIYIPADFLFLQEVDRDTLVHNIKDRSIELYLSMPRIIRKRDDKYLDFISQHINFFDGVLIKNLESLHFLQSINYTGAVICDATLYHWNNSALHFLKQFCDEFTYPLELTVYENRMLQDHSGEYIVYGRSPMMVSANCVQKTTDTCTKNINAFSQSLTDRYHKKLPVYMNCIHCFNEIYNAVCMSLHKEIPQLIKYDFNKFRLSFTNEDYKTTLKIVEHYTNIIKGNNLNDSFPLNEYTMGHYKEGAL